MSDAQGFRCVICGGGIVYGCEKWHHVDNERLMAWVENFSVGGTTYHPAILATPETIEAQQELECQDRADLLAVPTEADELTAAREELGWWEEWSNTVARLLPAGYDDDVAQVAIIERAVADMANKLEAAAALLDGFQRDHSWDCSSPQVDDDPPTDEGCDCWRAALRAVLGGEAGR